MWQLLFLLIISLPCVVQTLEPFDPWTNNDNACKPSMRSCAFELQATNAMTMFYKELYRVVATNNGILQKYDNASRVFNFDSILTGDGYPKLVLVFNHSLPGPMLHVYQGQKVYVRIHNNLPTETLSVHFHGIRQVETPSSDGIGRVTQLSILPGSSFLHEFIAVDEGTFWYHSHVHSQTAMGLLGAFIVHPKEVPTSTMKEFVLVLQDWQHFYTGEQHQLLVESSQFFPNDIEAITSSDTDDYFEAVDGSRAAEALVTSILINGRGQYIDPRNNESSTTPFERLIVHQSNAQYRIRLINGGSTFSLVFSIDQHPLQVVSSDGILFDRPILVDRIVVGLGERYDLIVNITGTKGQSWWVRADTLDKNNNARWHGRAILQIGNSSMANPTSNPRSYSSQTPCRILNCPFTQYGPGLDIICLTMQDIATNSAHLDQELLADTAQVAIKRSISLTMVEPTDEKAGYESINYISMHYPSLDKPILYIPKTAREKLPCSNLVQKAPTVMGEKCYNNIVANFNDIIEFLVVNYDSDQHPIHLHGSYFHILEQGLSQLNETTGLSIADNPNVECDDNQVNCKCVNCTTNVRLVKDTMIVPSRGYMRIRFRANNPGVWLFHCHTESHLDRGMAVMIHVAEDRIEKILNSGCSYMTINIPLMVFSLFLLNLTVSILFKRNENN